MSNYTLNNVRRLITHIDERDYWDLHLNNDSYEGFNDYGCLSSYIDTTNPECVSGDDLTSLSGYSYDMVCNNGLELENIGYTGVDNGLISYQKDRITNEEFYKIYTESTYSIESGDTRLHLHKVSGNTGLYDYPTSINDDGSIKLNGGFYQGFFKSGKKYSILPSYISPSSEWSLEFTIRKKNYEPESNRTLNNIHPDNKGIFFYIGTRAENKWVYLYDDMPLSGTSNDYSDDECDIFDLIAEDITLSAQTYDTDSGFSIDSPNDDYILSDNKFLIFSRAKSGVTISNYDENDIALIATKKKKFDKNLFLYMNRGCSGYTVEDIEELESGSTEVYDDETFYGDIYRNALAFMIKDDLSIGYRYIVKNCEEESETPYKIIEGFSNPGIIEEGEWCNIRIRIMAVGADSMKFMFYVNGKLKYITKELPKFSLRELNELQEKQEGVAFNISLGGGTQGLSESIFPEYMLNPTKVYPLEENFGGSFIGDIKEFKFHTC